MTLLNDRPISIDITSNTGTAAIPVNGLGNVGLFAILTGITSGQFTFEASINSTDGVNGNWFVIPGLRSNAAALESASGALSATPAYGWQFDVTCFNWFRVRATAGTFGTLACIFAPGANPKLTTLVAGAGGTQVVSGTVLATGPAARDAAISGNPVLMAGRVTVSNFTAFADNDVQTFALDGQGRQIVKPFSTNELDWQATMASDGATITTATTTALKTAIATYRQYVTAMQLHNAGGTATEIVLQDTTGTPVVLWRGFLPANMTQPYNVEFPTPLRTGSGTASGVSLRTITAGAAIRWSIQGFIGY